MVIISPESKPKAVREFTAEVLILYHQSTIKLNYQAKMHIHTAAQTCVIVDLEDSKDIMRTGDRGLVRFRFLRRPEYIKVGQRVLFREGRTKGLGVIKELH